MAYKLGANAKLYRLSTGTRASWGGTLTAGTQIGPAPSNLDEVPNVKDLTLPITKQQWDATTRGNNKYTATVGTLRDVEISLAMIYDTTDADVTALMTAFLNDANIALAILDGDKTTVDVQGLWADFAVVGMEKNENLAEGQGVTFTVKPGYSAVGPEWVKVAAA